MFTKANLEIYSIDVEDIITVSGEDLKDEDLGPDAGTPDLQ